MMADEQRVSDTPQFLVDLAWEDSKLLESNWDQMDGKAVNLVGFIGVILALIGLAAKVNPGQIRFPLGLTIIGATLLLILAVLFALFAWRVRTVTDLPDPVAILRYWAERNDGETRAMLIRSLGEGQEQLLAGMWKKDGFLKISSWLLIIGLAGLAVGWVLMPLIASLPLPAKGL